MVSSKTGAFVAEENTTNKAKFLLETIAQVSKECGLKNTSYKAKGFKSVYSNEVSLE